MYSIVGQLQLRWKWCDHLPPTSAVLYNVQYQLTNVNELHV